MVLHADELHALPLERVGRREVVGMQVVRDHLGRDGEQPLEVRDALAEGGQRLDVAEIADVVPDPRALAARQAERALELGSAREQRARRGDGQRLAGGDEAARAPQHHRPPAHGAHDGVVGADVDRAVVDEEGVGDPGEALAGVVVAIGDRLVGHVAAGQHERAARVVGEQVVQR